MWYMYMYLLISILDDSSFVDTSRINSFSSIDEPFIQKRIDESEPWKKAYLPNTIEPIRYDLHMNPHFSHNETINYGNVSIEVNVLKRTDTFIVHVKQFKVTQGWVLYPNGSILNAKNKFYWSDHDYHIMVTKQYVPAGSVITLYYGFDVNMTLATDCAVKCSGFYSIPYTKDGRPSWLVLADFGPSKARMTFPCFDEPRFKAQFRVTLQHWNTYTALFNMPVEKFVPDSGGIHYTVFKWSPKMSTFQVTFSISNYIYKSKTIDGTQYRIWTQDKKESLDKAVYALNVTSTIQNYLSRELDLKYPLATLDQIVIPDQLLECKGEKWGLTEYDESKLIANLEKNGDSARHQVLKLTSHSLAHYYFGNLVTCRSWEHVWLNEGLATFYDIRAMTAVDPSLLHKEFVFGWMIEEIMLSDAKDLPSALVIPSDSSKQVVPLLDSVRRDKGAAILRMVENFVGADTFRSAIRQYLRRHANDTVVTDDLWNALQRETGGRLNIKQIMNHWVERNGLPVVKVELLPGNRINATQKQFLDNPPFQGAPTYKWFVPLTYRSKGGTKQMVWMNETDVVFEISGRSSADWVECNYDRTGYYRVNYDAKLWHLIAKQLKEDHTVFTELSRTSFLSDAVALAKAEQLGYDVFLNLTRYASKEMGVAPWSNIYDGFNELRDFVNESTCCLKDYIRNLTRELMDKLEVKNEGNHMLKQLRPKIMELACSTGHRGCIENSTRAFKAWIKNETANPISMDYSREVYCYGIASSSDESEWNITVERCKQATTQTEISNLLRGLSCTRNMTLLERLLDSSLDTTVVPCSMSYLVIKYVANHHGNAAWEWLKRNYAEVDRVKGCGEAGKFLPHAVRNFNTPAQNQEVLDFYDVYIDVNEESKSHASSYISTNIHWMDRNFNTIVKWLEQNR